MRFTCYALGLGWGHLTQPTPGRLLFVNRPMVCCLITAALFARPLAAQTEKKLSVNDQRARNIFEQLININTTGSSGSTTIAVQVIGQEGSKNYNLVARLRSTGTRPQKPIVLLAHLDVVEARREDWSLDPFTFTEKDGFFYGRGTMDIKDGEAILVATLVRLKQEGYKPNRDLIVALTTGEEGGSDYNGVEWLLQNHRDLVDGAFVINMDSGDPVILNGKRVMRSVQASEKVYVTFKLEVHNPGGHSSLPTKDNAIYRLAAALGRVAAYEFPAQLNEITRATFERWATLQQGGGQLALALRCQPALQRAASDNLRRYGADGGPRRERAAADGGGHGELPRHARDAAGRGAGHARQSRQRYGRQDQRCLTRDAQPAVAVDPGGHGSDRASHEAPVEHPRRAGHGNRRH